MDDNWKNINAERIRSFAQNYATVSPFPGQFGPRTFVSQRSFLRASGVSGRTLAPEAEENKPDTSWTFSPPGDLGRVPPPGEQNLVGRTELNQPLHVLLRHCRWRGQRSAPTASFTHNTAAGTHSYRRASSGPAAGGSGPSW